MTCCEPQTKIETGVTVPNMTWAEETALFPDAPPYLGPAWLRATSAALPAAKPWHTVATSGAQMAGFIAGFRFDTPHTVDFDPRAYLGWEAPTGDVACCGTVVSLDGMNPTSMVEELGLSAFFPTLLLGSPLGFRTEATLATENPQLVARMVAELVHAATDSGVRSIVAPWIPDLSRNTALVSSLIALGGQQVFWGQEYHMHLTAASYPEHVARLPSRARVTVNRDLRRFDECGLDFELLTGPDARTHIGRIAELTCYNRSKHDGHERPEHVSAVLHGMLDAGADLRCYAAFENDVVVGSCAAVRKGDRLLLKWSGFDYELLGRRSGLYFPLILTKPVEDAYAENVRTIEFGAGSGRAKMRRGCVPRDLTSVLLLVDPAVRRQVSGLLGALGTARRTAMPAAVQPAGANCCAE